MMRIKAIWLLGLAFSLAACNDSGDSPDPVAANPPPQGGAAGAPGDAMAAVWTHIASLPYEAISGDESTALAFMREEEKLARDVYLYLFEIWDMPIFESISESEQRHMEAVLYVLQKYDLPDPAENRPRGDFANATLQGLYDSLVAQGSASLVDALIVGATIEDLDIFDLHQQFDIVDNQDITYVFENLLKGSRNHMRAFSVKLAELGVVYTPVYISQAEYDAIINSPMETGGF